MKDTLTSEQCPRTESHVPVGALPRLLPRGVDGEPERIGRVVWSRPTADGGHWLGISLLDRKQHQPAQIQPVRRPDLLRAHRVSGLGVNGLGAK